MAAWMKNSKRNYNGPCPGIDRLGPYLSREEAWLGA
jgi:hypothetical protein